VREVQREGRSDIDIIQKSKQIIKSIAYKGQQRKWNIPCDGKKHHKIKAQLHCPWIVISLHSHVWSKMSYGTYSLFLVPLSLAVISKTDFI
jgi:hypothetical protein